MLPALQKVKLAFEDMMEGLRPLFQKGMGDTCLCLPVTVGLDCHCDGIQSHQGDTMFPEI